VSGEDGGELDDGELEVEDDAGGRLEEDLRNGPDGRVYRVRRISQPLAESFSEICSQKRENELEDDKDDAEVLLVVFFSRDWLVGSS
jgi:hypothetical protein